MTWFRAKLRAGAGLALVAFVLQLLLTLGHTHAGELYGHGAAGHQHAWHHHDKGDGGLHDSRHAHAEKASPQMPAIADAAILDHMAPKPVTDQHHGDTFCAACFILAQAATSFIASSAVLTPPVRITTIMDASPSGPDATASAFAAFRSRAPPLS